MRRKIQLYGLHGNYCAAHAHSLGTRGTGALCGNQSAPMSWCLLSQTCFLLLNPPKWPQLNRSKQYTADLYSPIPVCISSNTEFQLEALMLYNQVLKTKGAQDTLQISIFHLISALLSILQTSIFHQYYFK